MIRFSATLAIGMCLMSSAKADEKFLSREEAEAQGYRLTLPELHPLTDEVLPAPHSLPWPVAFQDERHSLGNVMLQYQNYGGDAYFHGGCDLRTKDGESIFAPQAGKVEAGHYSYVMNPDGSATKYMKPWPERGDDHYFEVSITTPSGLRFEFHHVNRDSLPPEIREGLDRGDAHVNAGDLLGKVITWNVRGRDGSYYHHTHYNILNAQHVSLNPEYYSPFLPDTQAPDIEGIWARDASGKTETLQEGRTLHKKATEFVIGVTDQNNDNVYLHTPSRVRLFKNESLIWEWDFRTQLVGPDGRFPDIRQVFLDKLKTPEGRTLETAGNYYENFFLVRVPYRVSDSPGQLRFVIEDAQGNTSQRTVSSEH